MVHGKDLFAVFKFGYVHIILPVRTSARLLLAKAPLGVGGDLGTTAGKIVGMAPGFNRSCPILKPIDLASVGATTKQSSSKWSEHNLECFEGSHSWPCFSPALLSLITHCFLSSWSDGKEKNPFPSLWLFLQRAATQ